MQQIKKKQNTAKQNMTFFLQMSFSTCDAKLDFMLRIVSLSEFQVHRQCLPIPMILWRSKPSDYRGGGYCIAQNIIFEICRVLQCKPISGDRIYETALIIRNGRPPTGHSKLQARVPQPIIAS